LAICKAATTRSGDSSTKSIISVLGNHDLHLLALSQAAVPFNNKRFDSLTKTLRAPDIDELVDWLRRRPLAHYCEEINTLLVHAGTHPTWTANKTLRRATEVEDVLRGPKFANLLAKMYGNRPSRWSGGLKGYSRLRFIINCLTRMRMLTPDMRLNMRATGAPWRAGNKRIAWFDFPNPAWGGTRIVFGHWSQLGLIVLPQLISLDTGCTWGRQLTAVRLDRPVARVYQVAGQN
jgi:bis(5'-nucleosyl)-tetraphosphatase (symmetrical)